MKNLSIQLSCWARRNRLLAIVLLIGCKIISACLAFRLGAGAALDGLILPEAIEWFLVAAGITVFLIYPARRLRATLGRDVFYWRQKRADGALAVLSFAFLFLAGNLSPAWVASPELTLQVKSGPPAAMASQKGTLKGGEAPERAFGFVKKFKHKLKAKLAQKLSAWEQKSPPPDTAGKVALTLLTVLGLFLALGFIALISCNLSCAGNETAAAVVGILGVAGVVVSAIFIFRAIWKKRTPEEVHVDKRHQKKTQEGVDKRHQKKQ